MNICPDPPKTFGFATEEYEVTKDRLGVYLPVEHIDNPKYVILADFSRHLLTQTRGYAEEEGDARQYDRRLRPPVNPEELEIDPRTGMKVNIHTKIVIRIENSSFVPRLELHGYREPWLGYIHSSCPSGL